MKITKKEYQKFVETYDNVIEEIDIITEIKGIEYDEVISISENSIQLSNEVYGRCGDTDIEYHTITFEELAMDREDLIEEYEKQKEEAEKEARKKYMFNQARLKKEQEARDIQKYNELKKKLNK